MEEKLEKLYQECIEELRTINIDIFNNILIGEIDIKIAKRNSKRYGCCRQENPDKNFYHIVKRRGKKIKVYDKFDNHHIEICKWVMELDDSIIKNTIMHEIIHCFPECNNHGTKFKNYANIINKKLGYNITRCGNKEEDYREAILNLKKMLKGINIKLYARNVGRFSLDKHCKRI